MSVGLVLAGGGARGAYEVGALSVLLPELERRGERPRILVGTSIGALNAAFLAAAADRPAAETIDEGRRVWLETGFRDVAAPVLSPRSAWRFAKAGASLLSSHGVSLESVLDPAPMAGTLRRLIPFDRLSANLSSGALEAVAVAATSASTSRAVVFHQGGGVLEPDRKRGIDYVPTPIDEQHIAASAAIPAFFPAAPVDTPAQVAGNYWDGGVTLNTPIKPALALGAEKVVVIGLDSIVPRTGQVASGHEPDVVEGLQQFLGAAFTQPLLEDMRTLAGLNRSSTGNATERVPYVFVGPAEPEAVGRVAAAVWAEHYGALRHLLSRKRRDLAFLGRAVAAPADAQHGDLASYLFFCREFAEELLAMGARDAQAWLDGSHDDGPWEWGAQLE